MQGRFGPMSIIRDRFRWGGYGFFGGLVVGITLGWVFHNLFNAAFWILVVIALLIPLVAVILGWRRLTGGGRREETVESTSYVIEAQTEPRER